MCDNEILVVLPHYDCAEHLGMAVASVLAQEGVSIRLVLIDDCSPTDEWFKSLERFLPDSRIVILKSSVNIGPYRLRNSVIRLFDQQLIAFQDADDVSHPERLRSQLQCLRDTRASVVGCSFKYITSAGQLLRIKRLPHFPTPWMRLGKHFVMLHGTLLVTKDLFNRLNGFDGSARFGADSDFILRASYVGRMRNLRRILYDYRQRSRSLTASPSTGFSSAARESYRRALQMRELAIRNAKNLDEFNRLVRATDNNIVSELNMLYAEPNVLQSVKGRLLEHNRGASF